MNKNTSIIIIIAILVIGGGLYWMLADTSPTDTPTTQYTQTIQPAADAARKDLAAKLSIDDEDIEIVEFTETTWTDGCLGLGGPAESCLQAQVPGYKIGLMVNAKTYIYRTDKVGDVVKAEIK